MSAALPVTASGFEADVLQASHRTPVLVDFWAPWCGPCRMLGPVLDQVAGEFGDRLRVLKLNTDEEPAIAGRYQIRSIPAVKLFRNGQVVAEFVGAQPLGAVRAFLAPHLPKESDGLLQAARAQRAAGQLGAALQSLKAIVATAPADDLGSRVELAELLALTGEVDAARATLASLPPAAQAEPVVKGAYGLAHFARVALSPDETDAVQDGRVKAARALLRNDLETGLDTLLALMERNRRFATGQGREDLLHAFSRAAPDDARVARARRRLAALLH